MGISSVLHDPELGSVAFTVERITCTRSREGTVSRSVKGQAAGCIRCDLYRLCPEHRNTGG